MRIEARFVRAASLCAVLLAACRGAVVEPQLPPAWPSELAAEALTRERCVDLALHSAPNRAAWDARIELARARLEQARLLPNPTFSLGWEDFGLNAAARHNQVQTTLSLAMALEDLFARKRRGKIAEHELEMEEALLRVEMARTASEVSRAHDRLVADRLRREANLELARVAESQVAAVKKLVTAGIMAPIEIQRAEAELADASADLAASEAVARAHELEFAFALGFARPVALVLSDGFTAAQDPESKDLEELLALASRQRPELAAASAAYAAELERLHLVASRVSFLPVVGAGPRTQGSELSGVASIDVVLPIFDRGAAAKHAGDAELLAAAARIRAAAQAVASEVCAAWESTRAAREFLEAHARASSSRRRKLREDSEKLFRAGELDYAAVALARRDEVTARRAELDAELALALARIDLRAAVGGAETRR